MNSQDTMTVFTHRYMARIVLEAVTPLLVATGEKSILADAVIATDVNGLPYIPGTTLAGIVKHALDGAIADELFGFRETNQDRQLRRAEVKDPSKGSEIIFTDARMVNHFGEVMDGLRTIIWEEDFYRFYRELPVRQHVRINQRGVVADSGKFAEQVIYKGTRFCFEMEMISAKPSGNESPARGKDLFAYLLRKLQSDVFRIGGGTRCGFGEITVIGKLSKQATLDLTLKEQRDLYLDKTSDLSDIRFWDSKATAFISDLPDKEVTGGWTTYKLRLTANDFFLFGSGFGDEEADMTPVTEAYVDWTKTPAEFKTNNILIPATSIKGAMAHRLAFHWNRIEERFVENKEKRPLVGNENPAVLALFGSEGEKKDENKQQVKGRVILSDIIKPAITKKNSKLLNHISIDRFTGGTLDGALFAEKVFFGGENVFTLKILVENVALADERIRQAFEHTLIDIASGMLPLGGGVNRGHGVFGGIVCRNEELIYPKK